MHKNRDYFTRPIQGNGRDHWDYGNSYYKRPESGPEKFSRYFAYAVMAMVAAMFIYHGLRYFLR